MEYYIKETVKCEYSLQESQGATSNFLVKSFYQKFIWYDLDIIYQFLELEDSLSFLIHILKKLKALNEVDFEKKDKLLSRSKNYQYEFLFKGCPFLQMREEFIQTSLKEKYGDSKGQKRLTADEMSKFYKSFLDEHLNIHKEYNKEWYKRNVRNLLLSTRVWLQQKLSSNR